MCGDEAPKEHLASQSKAYVIRFSLGLASFGRRGRSGGRGANAG